MPFRRRNHPPLPLSLFTSQGALFVIVGVLEVFTATFWLLAVALITVQGYTPSNRVPIAVATALAVGCAAAAFLLPAVWKTRKYSTPHVAHPTGPIVPILSVLFGVLAVICDQNFLAAPGLALASIWFWQVDQTCRDRTGSDKYPCSWQYKGAETPDLVLADHTVGLLTRQQLINYLAAWPYKTRPVAGWNGGLRPDLTGTVDDISRAYRDGRIDASTHDAIHTARNTGTWA